MSTNFTSPVGRLVQGGMTIQQKKDDKGVAVKDDQGNPVMEQYLALAIRKDDPGLPAFYALFVAQAKLSFPHLIGQDGNISHPQFAWKVQDGDGVGHDGQSVAGKPGFAGHFIFKMATRFAPRCFPYGKYSPADQIMDTDKVIKKGHFIRVGGTIDGNGVTPDNRVAKPGLFVSPTLIEHVAFGEEIVSGPDPSQVFGQAAPITQLPPGASTTPILPAPGATVAPNGAPPLPGAAAAPAGLPPGLPPTGAPALPGAPAGLPPTAAAPPSLPPAAAPAGLPSAPPMPGAGMPAPPAGPVYQMTASAQGATREQLLAVPGWTDELLLAHGHMIRVS